MPSLLVMPSETFQMIQEAGLGLSKLNDINYMAKNLSVTDLADIHIALQEFPFSFSKELAIHLFLSPVEQLGAALSEERPDAEMLQDLYNRVNGRIDTYTIRRQEQAEKDVYQYELHAVDENLWVAVQQRLRDKPSDPSRLLLRANESFFDQLIAQALHTNSFERVCSTNLFTYYLGSLHS